MNQIESRTDSYLFSLTCVMNSLDRVERVIRVSINLCLVLFQTTDRKCARNMAAEVSLIVKGKIRSIL